MRYSTGYYYGYDEWNSLQTLNATVESVISQLQSQSQTINSTLYPYASDPSHYLPPLPHPMQSLLDNFTQTWSSNRNQTSQSFPTPTTTSTLVSQSVTTVPPADSFPAIPPYFRLNSLSSSLLILTYALPLWRTHT